MIDVKRLHEQAEELDRLLRLRSFPVGLKLLRSVDEIPEGAQRPVKDLGYHLSLCQALSLARRDGMTIAEAKEDMWCFEPVIGLGLEKPPQRFLEGYSRYPESAASTLEAGATWARNFPRFDYGLYSAVVVAPLAKVNFEPDLFMIYAEPNQIRDLLQAKNWLDGKDITPRVSATSACVYSIVPVIKGNSWHITIPCMGEFSRAACNSCDMIFSASIEILHDLLRALRASQAKGRGMPRRIAMQTEYPSQENYIEMAKLMGMDWVK